MGNLIKGVHHIAVKCKGLEEYDKTVAFYRDILGMETYKTWGEGNNSAIMLEIGGGSKMEIFASGTDHPGQGEIRHFALATDDVDACCKAVTEAGYDVFVQPNTTSLAGLPVRIAFCHGPVGEEIEFFCVL